MQSAADCLGSERGTKLCILDPVKLYRQSKSEYNRMQAKMYNEPCNGTTHILETIY